MEDKTELLKEKLTDNRGKRVIFLSHCILNENTRYLGGATRSGVIDETTDYLQEKGIGIVQMKCPEQKAWGGVLKKEMLRAYGAKNIPVLFRKLYINSFINKTKKIYQYIAKEITEEMEDYIKSGFEVVGIVGVKGSPSCGVSSSLDLKMSAGYLVNIDLDKIDKKRLNEGLYKECLSQNNGFFIKALKEEMVKKNIDIPFLEHDLLDELKGGKAKDLEVK